MSARSIVLLLRASDDDYQRSLRDDCTDTATRLGLALRVLTAENDPETQVAQINDCIERHARDPIAAILVSPVRETVLRLAAFDAARAGIGCVVLNRLNDYVEGLRRDYPAVPLFGVSADQGAIGRIQGQQFRRLLPQGGDLLYIQGSRMTSSAAARLGGVEEVLRGSGIAVTAVHGDWSADSGERAVRRWLRGDAGGATDAPARPRLVGAQSDEMALGARRALRAAAAEGQRPEIATVPVTGCDGSPPFGQRLVREGELTATVVVPSVAGAAVETLVATLEGGPPPPAEVLLPVSSFPALDDLHP
jgi:ABC-type sugar transport system substrate-binding protein